MPKKIQEKIQKIEDEILRLEGKKIDLIEKLKQKESDEKHELMHGIDLSAEQWQVFKNKFESDEKFKKIVLEHLNEEKEEE